MTLPRAAQPFVQFPALLRAHGFAVAPDQTIGFLQAITLLGPRHIEDIRRAGLAMLAIPKDREEEYNALFRAFFLGMTVPGTEDREDNTVTAQEPTGTEEQREQIDGKDEPGEDASAFERLSRRDFTDDPETALARFQREAPALLPRRRSYRFAPDTRGRLLDMRQTLRDAAKRDGEVFTLAYRRRKERHRRIVLLIDISGSMKDGTETTLAFAHALTRAATQAETFTLGTRLTRITPALRLRNREQALARASGLITDVDGGTRIGDALTAFLAVPRYAGFARGAVVLMLSDGLERGDPVPMISAVQRLSRIAWRLDWLTPLAGDPGYAPATAGLRAVLPDLTAFGDGASTEAIVAHVLSLARAPARRGAA